MFVFLEGAGDGHGDEDTGKGAEVRGADAHVLKRGCTAAGEGPPRRAGPASGIVAAGSLVRVLRGSG